MGRIGLDIYRGDSNLMFAVVQADPSGPGGGGDEDGVYRSRDRGNTWEHISDQNNRPMYYSLIRVDPTDPNRLYQGGANGYRSNDGGVTWTSDAAAGVHLDHHAWWINPENSDHQILGSDGGVSISWDRSDNWYQFRNLPISQFYEIGVDNQWPYHVCGVCRTTAPGALRPRPGRTRASGPATGTTSAVETASSPSCTRKTRG